MCECQKCEDMFDKYHCEECGCLITLRDRLKYEEEGAPEGEYPEVCSNCADRWAARTECG